MSNTNTCDPPQMQQTTQHTTACATPTEAGFHTRHAIQSYTLTWIPCERDVYEHADRHTCRLKRSMSSHSTDDVLLVASGTASAHAWPPMTSNSRIHPPGYPQLHLLPWLATPHTHANTRISPGAGPHPKWNQSTRQLKTCAILSSAGALAVFTVIAHARTRIVMETRSTTSARYLNHLCPLVVDQL